MFLIGLDPSKFQIAMVNYKAIVWVPIHLKQFIDKGQLKKVIPRPDVYDAYNFEAMKYTRKDAFIHANGERSYSEKISVFVSDVAPENMKEARRKSFQTQLIEISRLKSSRIENYESILKMLGVTNILQTQPKNLSINKKASTLSQNDRDKQLHTLHKSLTNEWRLNGPEVRRVFLNKDEMQTPKMKKVLVLIDEEHDELSKFEKGGVNMQKMARYEQMHKLQSALQNRIMAHKYNEPPSAVYINQLKSIQQLMDFLKRQLDIDKNPEGKQKLEGFKERIKRFRKKEPKQDIRNFPNCHQGWYFNASN